VTASAATSSAAPSRALSRGLIGLLLVAAPVVLMLWLIVWPIISAILATIWVEAPAGGHQLSFKTYEFFFSDGYSLSNLGLTIWTTVISAILLLVFCMPLSLYLRFSSGRLAAYVQSLAIFPMFVPAIILSYAFIRVLGPNGMVDILLNAAGLPKIRSPYLTPWGSAIGLVWDNIPLTVLILTAGLGNISNASVEAARDVGAGRLTVFRVIILPPLTNTLLVALSFQVLNIFSSFTLPYVLGPAAPEMMGPFMQRTFKELNNPTGAVTQAVIAFAFCLVFGLFYVRSVAKNRARG
jgi:ABC-type spermidine/putrescine transport system permease subunit I